MTRARLVDAFVQDVRYGVRTLFREPGWTIVAILTLGLGIGSTTAMFGVVNSLILHPLPYRDADRVRIVWRVDTKIGGVMMSGAPDGGRAWEQNAKTIEGLEPYSSPDATLSGSGDASTVHLGAIRSSFLKFTGMKTVLGRGFSLDETRTGGPRVAMLSEPLWRSRYGAARDVLGKSIVLDDRSYTIVGVTEASMRVPGFGNSRTDVWIPLNIDSLTNNDIIARLKPGVTKAAAESELATILNRITPGGTYETRVTTPGETASFRDTLVLLSAAVVMLMLVACANVAHLLLARGAARQRELAVRAALGAGRGRLARQLLTESSLLAAMGCAIGIGFGFVALRVMIGGRPATLGELASAQLDGRALIVAMAVSIATAVIFGCTSALHAIRRTTPEALRTTSQSDGATRRTHRVRAFLVVTEMALSAMLLVGTSLVTRSVVNLQHVDPGFDTRGLYSFALKLPRTRYPSPQEREAFAQSVLDRFRALSDVESVALGRGAPPTPGGYMMRRLEGDGIVAKDAPGFLAYNNVADNYFSVLRAPVLAGRVFTTGSDVRREVVISEGLSKQLWHGEAAVGRRIRFASKPGTPNDWSTVIGVVGDVTSRGLSEEKSNPVLYLPLDHQNWPAEVRIVVRARPNVDLVAALRPIVPSMDRRLTPPAIRTMDAILSETIGNQRFTMTLLAAFAGLAVALSAIGLYGVISYVVTQRAREIGIRVALGATPRNIAQVIVARGLALSGVGLVIGLGVSVWGTKLIQRFLYGVKPTDPLSYAAAALLLLTVCVLASAIPMRRAVGIDPTIAMRGD